MEFVVGPLAMMLPWTVHATQSEDEVESRECGQPGSDAELNGTMLFPIYNPTTNLKKLVLVAVAFMVYGYRYHPVWFGK